MNTPITQSQLTTCLHSTRNGSRYAGSHEYNEAKDKVKGCPARVSNIQTLLKSIKAKAAASGTIQKHAEPITIDDLLHIISWSEAQYPPESLYKLSKDSHAFMRAFMTTTLTLWTRCMSGISHCFLVPLSHVKQEF